MNTIALNNPAISISWRVILEPRAFTSQVLLTFLCLRAHEYAHVIGTVIQGSDFQSEFFRVKILSENEVAPMLLGPALSFILLWSGLGLLYGGRHWRLFGFQLIFASTPLFRMTGYMLSTIPGRDETSVLLALHIHPLVAVAVIWMLAILPLFLAYRAISPDHRRLCFILLFLVVPLACAFVLRFGDNTLLPLLRQHTGGNTLVAEVVTGIPNVVLLFDLVLISLFFCLSRLQRNRLRGA